VNITESPLAISGDFWIIFRDITMDEDYEEFLSYAEADGNANLGNMTVSWFFNFFVFCVTFGSSIQEAIFCQIRNVFILIRIRYPGVILSDPDPTLIHFVNS
jgi:hypothetical protein